GRNPRQNISAEQAALGSMLLQEDAIMHTVEILKPEDFYRKSHEIIYRSISELFDKSNGVDLVTLTEELKRKDLLEKIGGITYLTNLINSVPTAANIEYYVKIIEEKSILRNLINSATKIVSMGYEEKEDAKVLMDKAEHLMFDVSQRNLGQTFIPIKEILQDSFEKIEDLYHREEYITGVPSGFAEFDDITTGFQPSELIIIAGRPGMGKTAFCMNIAQNAAISKNTSVAIFSLEMSKSQLVQRMLCSEARVDAHNLRKGGLAESDWPTLSMAAGRLSSAPIFIDDSAGATSLEIKAKARRLKAQHNLGLIIIDYMQLMQNSSKSENRQQEISEISRS
ncbi:MAG: replicative DNA helicase, partial [Candidatus Atribacteria bacterium]|nr:replicative DNA helicase [Candidatus Atribacteria bacterium]